MLAVGGLVLWFVSGPLRRMIGRTRLDPSAASFLANTARGVLLVAVLPIALDQLGVQTTSLIALLGVAGLAVGLALQGSLANFASGLLILSFRTVRVGDWIEVGGVRGQVREMQPFHIVLVSEENRVFTVPNTMLTGGAVANDSALPTRRVRWTLPVAAGADLTAVKEALAARLRADSRVLAEPAPRVVVEEWAADHCVLTATAWTSAADRAAVQRDLLEELGKTLAPSPSRDRKGAVFAITAPLRSRLGRRSRSDALQLIAELLVGRRAALGQQPRLGQRQMGIGEGEEAEGGFQAALQGVAAVGQLHADAGGAYQAEVAVEAADVDFQPPRQRVPRQRPFGDEVEQTHQPLKAIRRHAGRSGAGGGAVRFLAMPSSGERRARRGT